MMQIISAPDNFENTDEVNEGIKDFVRINEVIRFVKGYFHDDVKDLRKSHTKAEIRLHLKSVGKAPIIIGISDQEEEETAAPAPAAKPAPGKTKTKK